MSPREQLSLKPVWCESTYGWNTDNCPVTSVSKFENSKQTIIAAFGSIARKMSSISLTFRTF